MRLNGVIQLRRDQTGLYLRLRYLDVNNSLYTYTEGGTCEFGNGLYGFQSIDLPPGFRGFIVVEDAYGGAGVVAAGAITDSDEVGAVVDAAVTASHGAGAYTQPTVPTAAEVAQAVDAAVISSHGEGAYTQPTVPTPAEIAAQVDAALSATHGEGAWTQPVVPSAVDVASQVDTTLTAAHGAGDWTGGGSAPTAQEVAEAVGSALSTAHGAGSWEAQTPPVPPTAEEVADAVDITLSAAHGDGQWDAIGNGGFTDEDRAKVDAIKTRTDRLGELTVGVLSPVAADGQITLHSGDDYPAASPVAITLPAYVAPDLAGASVQMVIKKAGDYKTGGGSAVLTVDGALSVDGAAVTATFTLTAAQTGGLTACPPAKRPNYWYQVLATTAAGEKRTLASGPLTILARVAQ